jgi:predicted histone-like DNA-binding protein
MKYKMIAKANPQDRTAAMKYYANPVKSGDIDQKAIAKEIASRSSLTAGDVANVLENFLELLPTHLIDGKSVKLGNLGSFRISFSSEGVEKAKDFNAATQIKTIRTIFTPSPDFKRLISEIKFEKE